MRCPFCGALETKVIDSRLAGDNDQVRRRRECVECSERFTTYEGAELNLPRVVKQSGQREPFNEQKLKAGILSALQKRPVSLDAVDKAISRIKHQALVAGEREIATHAIGHWVMDELRQLDKVAYVRFASVYRSFEDVAQFREEADRLSSEAPHER